MFRVYAAMATLVIHPSVKVSVTGLEYTRCRKDYQKNYFGHHVDFINLFYEISIAFYVPSDTFVSFKLLWFLRIFFQYNDSFGF